MSADTVTVWKVFLLKNKRNNFNRLSNICLVFSLLESNIEVHLGRIPSFKDNILCKFLLLGTYLEKIVSKEHSCIPKYVLLIRTYNISTK